MQNWIEHVLEPERLLLAWQAPDPAGIRKRFAVGELVREGDDCILRYFTNEETAAAEALGYAGYPAFRYGVKEHRQGVLPVFLRRLPPRNRPDLAEYKSLFRLRKDAVLSDFALLAYTEAKLPSDGFSLVNTLEGLTPPCELFLELAGYRYYVDGLKAPPRIGAALTIEPEPQNERDRQAIVVRLNGQTIGYINRLQTSRIHGWLQTADVSAVLERLNGHSDKPRAFIFLKVSPRQAKAAA